MSCCSGIAVPITAGIGGNTARAEEIRLASRDLGDGLRQTILTLPDVHCAACIAAVEGALRKFPGVELARVNLSVRRVTINWRGNDDECPDFAAALAKIGYASHLASIEEKTQDPVLASF